MAEPVDTLGPMMREVAAAQRVTLEQRDVLARVRRRPPALRPARRGMIARLPKLGFAFPALAAAAGVALWFGSGGPGLIQPRLSFSIGEGAGAAPAAGEVGDPQEATQTASLPLRFSDGSRVILSAGARAHVAKLDGRGATVVLEKGRAEVDVRHQRDTQWRLLAGGFEVAVTGTRFTLDWDTAAESLTVLMAEGTVEVRGPGIGGGAPVVVSAGQRFRATSATSAEPRWTLAAANAPGAPRDPAPDEAAAPHPSEAPRPPALPARPALSAPAAAGAPRTWQIMAHAGRYDEALKMVERLGFERACRRLAADDLIQLGDAARLARSPARAETAYRTAHRRFPNSDRPVFALGLVAFEQRRDFKQAAHWFDSYGRRYPKGALALEAVGREMESWHRAGDDVRARRAARRYLERDSQGPYAALARQISSP